MMTKLAATGRRQGSGDVSNETRWRRTLAWLRAQFPPRYPTTVRRKSITDYANTTFDNCRFRIVIDRDAAPAEALDALLHEWAHCLTWHGNDVDNHGDEWALAYGRIYRAHDAWAYGFEAKATNGGDK